MSADGMWKWFVRGVKVAAGVAVVAFLCPPRRSLTDV